MPGLPGHLHHQAVGEADFSLLAKLRHGGGHRVRILNRQVFLMCLRIPAFISSTVRDRGRFENNAR
jgi:hypothetical protein